MVREVSGQTVGKAGRKKPMKCCEIMVVGAGPAGVALATVLRRDGIAVSLVDGGGPCPALEGYSARTMDRLRAAGLFRAEATLSAAVSRSGTWARRPVSGSEHLDRKSTRLNSSH